MMKRRSSQPKKTKGNLWGVSFAIPMLCVALVALTAASFFWNKVIFAVELAVSVLVIVLLAVDLSRRQRLMHRFMGVVLRRLDQSNQDVLTRFPLPVVTLNENGEVVWYNEPFRSDVLGGEDHFGEMLSELISDLNNKAMKKPVVSDVSYGSNRFTVFISEAPIRKTHAHVLYFIDDTALKNIADEYAMSRPSVMMVYIDNLDDVMQDARESERAQVLGKAETLLENWVGKTTGILRKFAGDRYMIVVEQRHMQAIIDDHFSILDEVHRIETDGRAELTLSIGVGQGKTMAESEKMARQALEMALGRGGDQAALKTKNGYDFYGGLSKGVERHTKVRTRVIASALSDMIRSSETVLAMGHRYSDLDCLGSSIVLALYARSAGKAAYVVVDRASSLAPELIERYCENGQGDLFLSPEQALPMMDAGTLLMVSDTQNPQILESPDVYAAAEKVVVIDHHRRMVNHIDNAVIFFHEPNASSASEMVAELMQYLDGASLTRMEAEALLAGIMLDTRGFVMKAGVRTFEAAAFLRQRGADTVAVKQLFSKNMEVYRAKSDMVAHAEIYDCTAITCVEMSGAETRLAAAQAADELLSIKGVDASFALFPVGKDVNVSARSMGRFNVQLVMERIGGGGHQAMAGALLPNMSVEQARTALLRSIDEQLDNMKRSAEV